MDMTVLLSCPLILLLDSNGKCRMWNCWPACKCWYFN